MYFFSRALALFVFICALSAPIVGQAAENLPLDYVYADREERARLATIIKDDLVVTGSRYNYFFNQERTLPRCRGCTKPYGPYSAGGMPLEGYAFSMLQRPDGKFVVVGVEYKSRYELLSKDSRQGFSALVEKLKGHNNDIQKFEYGRIAVKVILAEGNQTLTLFQADGSNMIALMDSQHFVRKKVKFGSGAKVDMARHANGDISVLGFEASAANKEVPVYWRFSSDLKELEKISLKLPFKSRNSTDAVVKIAVSGEDVYILYGIPDGVKDKRPDGMVFRTLEDGKFKKTMTYNSDAVLTLTPAGAPIVAAVIEGRPRVIRYNAAKNDSTVLNFPPPTDPVVCFVEKGRIRMVDVVFDAQGRANIVLGSKPLNHPAAGCLAIGITKL